MACGGAGAEAQLSVVVPTLNEAVRLPSLIRDLEALPFDYDLIVVDGGSTDGTPGVAEKLGARVVTSPPGRGAQLRRGVAAATSSWILVLHADVRLSPEALSEVSAFIFKNDPDRYAAWPLELDSPGIWLRLVEAGAALRWRWLDLPYGDQGLLLHRSLYDRVGGYPESPIMEDVALVRALSRVARPTRFRVPLQADARRYRREGGIRRFAANLVLLGLFYLGVPPARLARWYRPEPVRS